MCRANDRGVVIIENSITRWKEEEIRLNTFVIRIYRCHPYLFVEVLGEAEVEGKKDSYNCVFSTGILGGHKKVPI